MMYKMAVAVDDEVPNLNSFSFDSDGIVVIVKRKTCGDTRRQDEKWKDSSASKWLGARLMCQLSPHHDCPLFC